jgi:hypothetical protein
MHPNSVGSKTIYQNETLKNLFFFFIIVLFFFSGDPITYTNWSPGEPNNAGESFKDIQV